MNVDQEEFMKAAMQAVREMSDTGTPYFIDKPTMVLMALEVPNPCTPTQLAWDSEYCYELRERLIDRRNEILYENGCCHE